ncbi:DUF305 domain-containing protein [Lacisediminimonas sp.]|uniref:DUF305 domain-containing protein n=1 Tax=Lacisediminimonas sp. TaxID=3060582 RepID=UPI002718A84E|nr:DUF305 domain-containing protein [Lacisediminimonas sp.]MDO8299314.1 DUF305 domain-containing protein [Lacisediminimonas sp.]
MLPSKKSSRTVAFVIAVGLAASQSTAALADGPGRGLTAQFERDYLAQVIDHHFSALRMTELAAGTDTQRDPAVNNPQEGTAPTPGATASPAKATDGQIRSMARQANRAQREEIAKAQKRMRDWYGNDHQPSLTPEGQQGIHILEQAPTGTAFNQAFLEVFSSHHYSILAPSVDCLVKSDLAHDDLRRTCENVVVTQKNQINDMRQMLCKMFSICDFLPGGIRGQRS